jgi:RimJ/RimL family protein N-acetyltransferase
MNIKGKKITLRAIEAEDLNRLQVWANDPDIQYMLGGWHFPTNMNDQKKWFEALSCNSNHQRFIIINEGNVAVGMANLVNINFKDGNAEHGLLLDPQFQGKGYGYDVVTTIMKYAFEELRLNRLETTIIANNTPSLSLFEKCKWKQEGILRSWYYRKGQYIDKVFLGILKEEFSSK